MKKDVAIIMGSDSDWPMVQKTCETLERFSVSFEVKVISAHRTPRLATQFAGSAMKNGYRVIIAAAGGSAHLAGVVAAHTVLPVIGIPVAGGALNGIDSLLSVAQMPAGIPVATVTLGSAGPVNAAILAVQILALSDARLRGKLVSHKKELEAKVVKADIALRKQWKKK